MKFTEKIKQNLLDTFTDNYFKSVEKRKSVFLKKLQEYDKKSTLEKCSKNIFRFTILGKTHRIVVQKNNVYYDTTNYN